MRNRVAAVATCLALVAAYPAFARIAPFRARTSAPDTSWVSRSAVYEVFVRDFSRTGEERCANPRAHRWLASCAGRRPKPTDGG